MPELACAFSLSQDNHITFLQCPRFLPLCLYLEWCLENCDTALLLLHTGSSTICKVQWKSYLLWFISWVQEQVITQDSRESQGIHSICMRSTSQGTIWKDCNLFQHSALKYAECPRSRQCNGKWHQDSCGTLMINGNVFLLFGFLWL